MRRFNYQMRPFSFNSGDIGRLQTQMLFPVVAGDSIELNFSAIYRLASLRRNLTLDAVIDTFAFFVPHRHIYGSDWTDFIRDGVDEAVTFTNGPAASGQGYFATRRESTELWPLWVVAGYNRIWNRYFRAPTDTASERSDTAIETSGRGQEFGVLCGRLKKPWTTGIEGEPVAADRQVSSTSVVDLVEFSEIQARYKTEALRSWFATRYTDILAETYGGSANPDADERPTLCYRVTKTLSDYDVDGTDAASLGTFSGKSASVVTFNMPSKFFTEHGALWIMCLVRFPMVHGRERHYLVGKPNPTYEEISGDPEVIGNKGPYSTDISEWFNTGATDDLGAVPYGQWYRYQPDFVHLKYQNLTGFPFLQNLPVNATQARYHRDGEYDNTFNAAPQLGQWNSAGRFDMMVKRVTPTAVSSIMAGAN